MSELNHKEVNEQMYLFVKRWLDDLPFEECKKVPVMAIGYCLARLSKQDELLKEHEAMMQCINGKCRVCPHCVNCDDGIINVLELWEGRGEVNEHGEQKTAGSNKIPLKW